MNRSPAMGLLSMLVTAAELDQQEPMPRAARRARNPPPPAIHARLSELPEDKLHEPTPHVTGPRRLTRAARKAQKARGR